MSAATAVPANGELVASVNGESRAFAPGTTIADVVAVLTPTSRGVAVARNGDVVPKSSWVATAVEAGDRLEILTAAQGG